VGGRGEKDRDHVWAEMKTCFSGSNIEYKVLWGKKSWERSSDNGKLRETYRESIVASGGENEKRAEAGIDNLLRPQKRGGGGKKIEREARKIAVAGSARRVRVLQELGGGLGKSKVFGAG